MIWFLRILVFFIACFVVLPLIQVENPFRSIALRFFAKDHTADVYQHDCNPDRVYLYEYTFDRALYRQRYDGYIETLDQKIPESMRCSGALNEKIEIAIRYFPYLKYWSEPVDAIRSSLMLFLMLNLVKFGSVLLLILTFVRKNS